MAGSEVKQYKLPDGRILFASSRNNMLAELFRPAVNLSEGTVQDVFMTCTRRESGVIQRYKTKSLPLRKTLQEAQADLDAYAKANNLEPDTLVKIRRFDPDPSA